MIYKKLKILCFFLIIIFSANIYANCQVTINQGLSGWFSSFPDPNNSNIILTKVTVSSWTNHDIILTKQNCEGKTIVFVVDDNKTINITGSQDDLLISGMDRLEFRGNSSIIFNIDNDDHLVQLTTIDINTDVYTANNTKARMEFNEAERSWSTDQAYRNAHGIKVISNNLFVEQNSDLNLSIISKNVNDNSDSYDGTYSGINGGPAILDLNSIINYGNLKLDLVGGNGGGGSHGKKGKDKVGGSGGLGGDVNFSVDYINVKEIAKFNAYLKSGFGGNGGNGSREGGYSGCSGEPKSGGVGGDAGDVNFKLSDFFSGINSNINIQLNSGNGGVGGNGGRNTNWCSYDQFANGSLGGNGGLISFSEIEKINNSGAFLLVAVSGNGSSAGKKCTHCNGGSNVVSGDGGSISDLNILNFINNSENVTINLLSGKKGVNAHDSSSTYFGKPGAVGNININYLENNKRGIEILKRVNQTTADTTASLKCNGSSLLQIPVGDIKINYLASGSYLPKKLKTISAYQIDNTKIEINACYIKSSGLKRLEYQTGQLTINSANTDHFLNDFDYDKSRILVFNRPAITCPICDALELTNLNRVDDTYTIYSNNSGTINAGDLKIYYVIEDGEIFKPNHLLSSEEYVVYTNNSPIIGTISQRFVDPVVYEYVLSKDKLFSPRYNVLLSEVTDSKAYCSGQQYKIKGTITLDDGSSKTFDFPFIPIYGFE